ncbi:hypothetical protein [Olleya sp. HaHaR_3_96]|uniref:hypothetical protein n=1 Tax=Olleya sp. HaHaR_3_96 TaxID=2745560 RepID=UPI001C4E58F4|nr:hypothetical protein [Olleya sp. HaHaR_3_96]QXP58354.1 hypothetical protein H0I26_10510 [Olleya sp. HaHaR_3_96]
MTKSKIVLFFASGILIVFLVFVVWYNYKYGMSQIDAFEINVPCYEQKIVIATQGSPFKNAITKKIVNHYRSDSIYMKIINVEDLQTIDPENYNAVIIIHTWENLKPPMTVVDFFNKIGKEQNNVIVLTTSGQGYYKMQEVDAITGESRLDNVNVYTRQIIEKVNSLLSK